MSSPPHPTRKSRFRRASERLSEFWQRVTEGVELQDLWAQFKSEARSTYGLYSQEVNWEKIQQLPRWKKPFWAAGALFWVLLMKLSPARRLLLLLAVMFLLWPSAEVHSGRVVIGGQFAGLGATLLFLLLALELADRVTMKRDLEIAREIQRLLVPAKPPQVPGVDLAFATRPANTVAGDYYDAFLRGAASAPGGASGEAGTGTGPLMLVVADVAGKSVPAALLMATFQASLQALATLPSSVEELSLGLNRYACAHSLGGLRFTTAFLAELVPATGALSYVNAGHNAPILRSSTGRVERLEAGGLPLGIDAGARYNSGQARLGPGDLLVIFTDGVVEAVNERNEEYGETRLLERLRSLDGSGAEAALHAVMGSVESFAGPTRQHDDITCLVVKAI